MTAKEAHKLAIESYPTAQEYELLKIHEKIKEAAMSAKSATEYLIQFPENSEKLKESGYAIFSNPYISPKSVISWVSAVE